MVQYKQAMGLRRHSGQIVKDMSLIVVGSLLFSVSMNCIILPSGMYSGGFLGIAQLLRMVLLSVFPSLQSVGDVVQIWTSFFCKDRPVCGLLQYFSGPDPYSSVWSVR